MDLVLIWTLTSDQFTALFSLHAPRDSKTWSTSGIEGVHRFLGRTWRLIVGSPLPDGTFKDGTVSVDEEPTLEQLRCLHKCIAKVNISIFNQSFVVSLFWFYLICLFDTIELRI